MKRKIYLDCIFLTLVYLIFPYRKWKKAGLKTLIINSLIYFYLVGVARFTIMPLSFKSLFTGGRNRLCLETINLVAFIDLRLNRGRPVLELVLNLIMTLPFGFLYGLKLRLKGKSPKLLRAGIYGFLFSLLIESIQLFGVYINKPYSRSFDITDLIMNSLGSILGYMVFKALSPLIENLMESLTRS